MIDKLHLFQKKKKTCLKNTGQPNSARDPINLQTWLTWLKPDPDPNLPVLPYLNVMMTTVSLVSVDSHFLN